MAVGVSAFRLAIQQGFAGAVVAFSAIPWDAPLGLPDWPFWPVGTGASGQRMQPKGPRPAIIVSSR
jgi:hypothetical protein